MPENCPTGMVRFGLFELDLQTGELRKRGVKVALQEQPFQVLAMLVASPGELVTRDDLRQRLWADAVFVDFDHGLNKAVGKIRRALGDLANSPHFVETLERRGYRFIAPVERVALAGVAPAAPSALVARFVWNDRAIPLARGTHLIGRDPASAIWIDSSFVSRQHARVVVDDGGVSLEDLLSRNGTIVNGALIARACLLSDGDEIVIGPAHLVVRLPAADTATLTAPR